jgi:hypothetical protein
VSGIHLNSHHRDTLAQIFSQPASANTEWRRVLSLLEAVGTVTKEHNGKLKVTVGAETEFLPGRTARTSTPSFSSTCDGC